MRTVRSLRCATGIVEVGVDVGAVEDTAERGLVVLAAGSARVEGIAPACVVDACDSCPVTRSARPQKTNTVADARPAAVSRTFRKRMLPPYRSVVAFASFLPCHPPKYRVLTLAR